jgi:hypothetical protein
MFLRVKECTGRRVSDVAGYAPHLATAHRRESSRIRCRIRWAATGIAALAYASAAYAQQDSLASLVEIAALKHVQGEVKHQTLLFERRVANPTRVIASRGLLTEPRPASRNAALTAALGVRAASKDEVITCAGDRPRCAIPEGTVLVALSEPDISGDSATVEVTVWQYSRQRPPLHEVAAYRARLSLARTSRGWETVDQKLLVIS